MSPMPAPRVLITYCTQCRWLLRAAWVAQELLTTFQAELGEVALVPATGGVFQISIDGDQIWDRAGQGGFPELSELTLMVTALPTVATMGAPRTAVGL